MWKSAIRIYYFQSIFSILLQKNEGNNFVSKILQVNRLLHYVITNSYVSMTETWARNPSLCPKVDESISTYIVFATDSYLFGKAMYPVSFSTTFLPLNIARVSLFSCKFMGLRNLSWILWWGSAVMFHKHLKKKINV